MPHRAVDISEPVRKMPERVTLLREARGISKRQLEIAAALPSGWLTRFEKSEQWPSADLVVRLARALEVPIGELFGEPAVQVKLDSEATRALLSRRFPAELKHPTQKRHSGPRAALPAGKRRRS